MRVATNRKTHLQSMLTPMGASAAKVALDFVERAYSKAVFHHSIFPKRFQFQFNARNLRRQYFGYCRYLDTDPVGDIKQVHAYLLTPTENSVPLPAFNVQSSSFSCIRQHRELLDCLAY